LIPTTEEVVRDLLYAAPRARVALKRLINARYGVVDRITFDESVHGDEVVEGFEAFVQKRSPSWVPADTHPEGRA
jgi:1,4-dihydroxy-2-naphthoyl-CoA synthase